MIFAGKKFLVPSPPGHHRKAGGIEVPAEDKNRAPASVRLSEDGFFCMRMHTKKPDDFAEIPTILSGITEKSMRQLQIILNKIGFSSVLWGICPGKQRIFRNQPFYFLRYDFYVFAASVRRPERSAPDPSAALPPAAVRPAAPRETPFPLLSFPP